MDYDSVMLYVKENPDCSSLDLSREFGVTVAKAFTYMNRMVRLGLAFKTLIRSPTNNKRIYGYRVIPGFDDVDDNEDGSIPMPEAVAILRRCYDNYGPEIAMKHLASMNQWRLANNVQTIDYREVVV